MRTYLSIFATILFANNAVAEVQRLESCLAFSDDKVRLRCYDKVANFKVAEETKDEDKPSTPVTNTETSKWVFIENSDDFTDKDTSFVILDPKGYIPDDAPKSLVVRCDGRKGYEIYVIANGYIGARNGRVPVRYRFGDEEPISERWSESTDGTAAFLPKSYNDFKKRLASGEDFIFEITDFRGNRAKSEFDNNIDERLSFVMNGCR